jgi:hypothetical protein
VVADDHQGRHKLTNDITSGALGAHDPAEVLHSRLLLLYEHTTLVHCTGVAPVA